MSKHKDYLGDGVYVDITDWGQLVLTTGEDKQYAANTIYLEPEVMDALVRYVKRMENRED